MINVIVINLKINNLSKVKVNLKEKKSKKLKMKMRYWKIKRNNRKSNKENEIIWICRTKDEIQLEELKQLNENIKENEK